MVRIALVDRRSRTVPSASDRIEASCRFGMNRRLVLLLAWLTLLPTSTPLPVMTHRRAIGVFLNREGRARGPAFGRFVSEAARIVKPGASGLRRRRGREFGPGDLRLEIGEKLPHLSLIHI